MIFSQKLVSSFGYHFSGTFRELFGNFLGTFIFLKLAYTEAS